MCSEKKMREIRASLARSARKKGSRSVKFSRSEPTEWNPQKCIDPRTDEAFTPDGAWDFVAEKLEDKGVEVELKPLDKPRGKKGYVMKIKTRYEKIYIKVQFGNGGKIIGRSFH